jgi:hypothetical protein
MMLGLCARENLCFPAIQANLPSMQDQINIS